LRIFTQWIRNYTARRIDVEIRRMLPGHVVVKGRLDPKLHDYQTVEHTPTVPAGKRADLLHSYFTTATTPSRTTSRSRPAT
jgi:hypothetical protein